MKMFYQDYDSDSDSYGYSHGNVNLFMNRCRHRANSVCQFEQGNSAFFRCAYHGWTYKNSGELVGVPYAEGAYAPELPLP